MFMKDVSEKSGVIYRVKQGPPDVRFQTAEEVSFLAMVIVRHVVISEKECLILWKWNRKSMGLKPRILHQIPIEIKALQLTLEDLFIKLRKLNPQYAAIIEGIYNDKTHYEIGLELGKTESAIQEQAKKALDLARKILSE